MQQPGIPKKSNTMLIVAVVAVVAIVIVAVLALVLMRGGAGMTIQITDWDTDQNTLSVLSGEVTFTVDLTNTGTATSTGVVTCKLVLSAGGTIQQTQSVTLAPGASTTITVIVPATSFLQYAFLSTGQATCTIA
jgi:uncharacterized repeat protein (TIGR01451 family)